MNDDGTDKSKSEYKIVREINFILHNNMKCPKCKQTIPIKRALICPECGRLPPITREEVEKEIRARCI